MCGIISNSSPSAIDRREHPRTLNSKLMKFRIDAYLKNGAVKQGTKLLEDIDTAIKLAKQVASHYHCYTRIARVQD